MKQDMNKESFIELYNSLSDGLFRYCLVRTSNWEQSKDIVQDTFMRFWDVISRKTEEGESGELGVKSREIEYPRALLYTIATNLIIDWYRKKKSVSLDQLLEPEDEEGLGLQLSDESHEQIETQAEAKLLIERIKELDPQYQNILYLRFVEDLPPKEIAEIMNLNANTVSVRINRGISELQKMVGEHKDLEK